MGTIVNVDVYQSEAAQFADYPKGTIGEEGYKVTYIYPALGLAEEAGEVAGKFAKAVRDNNGILTTDRKEEIVKELGDVCWFVAELCNCIGVPLATVLQKNIDKLQSRKERGKIHGSGDNR